jgi:hypothetical protein
MLNAERSTPLAGFTPCSAFSIQLKALTFRLCYL